MTEDNNSANIEWEQKKGIDNNSRMSRRFDLKKTLEAEAQDRQNFKATAKQVKTLPPSLKKLRTKIKDVYDEDEDEEENEVIFNFSLEDAGSSLLEALKDDEKKELQAQKTLENQKMQQTAGKMEALTRADKMSKQIGLKGLKRKIINDGIQDIAPNTETFDKAITQNVAAKTKIKMRNKDLSPKETAAMVKGLKKMNQAAAVIDKNQANFLDDIRAEDVIKIGRSADEQKTANLILEKSGRKDSKQADDKKERRKEQQRIKNVIKDVKVRE